MPDHYSTVRGSLVRVIDSYRCRVGVKVLVMVTIKVTVGFLVKDDGDESKIYLNSVFSYSYNHCYTYICLSLPTGSRSPPGHGDRAVSR